MAGGGHFQVDLNLLTVWWTRAGEFNDTDGGYAQVDLNMLTGLVEAAPPPTVGNLPLQLGSVDPVRLT